MFLLVLCTFSIFAISDSFAMLPDTEIAETTGLTELETNAIIDEMENKGYEVYQFMTDNDKDYILFREALSPIPTPRAIAKIDYISYQVLLPIVTFVAVTVLIAVTCVLIVFLFLWKRR